MKRPRDAVDIEQARVPLAQLAKLVIGAFPQPIQRFELRTYLPGDLLCKEDRATMAVGLEARVPLLDEALLDLAERTPDHRKMSLRQGKIILRETL